MTSRIDELRNRLATAMLTVTAMLDGKIASNRANLERVSQSLADVQSIVLTVRNGDWEQSLSTTRLFELRDVIETVVRDLGLIASAAGTQLIVGTPDPAPEGCFALRGRPEQAYRAVEQAVRHLLRALPAATAVEITTPYAQVASVAVRPRDDPGMLAALLEIAAILEAYDGRAHAGEDGCLCLHVAAATVCPCAAAPACG
jgi:hypothetical protein